MKSTGARRFPQLWKWPCILEQASPSILASQPAVCKHDFLSRSYLWLVTTEETVDSRRVVVLRDMPCWSAYRSSNWRWTSRDRFPESKWQHITIISNTGDIFLLLSLILKHLSGTESCIREFDWPITPGRFHDTNPELQTADIPLLLAFKRPLRPGRPYSRPR